MNFLPQQINKKLHRGFTLIELLVVIAIIGLLSSIIFSSLANSRTKAYNALIVQERHSLEVALQTYFNDNGYLPGPSQSGNPGVFSCVGAQIGSAPNCIWPSKTFTANLAFDFNPSPKQDTSFFQQLALISGVNNNQLVNYLPRIYFTQSVFLNNAEYRGLVYDCYAYDSNKHCTNAAIYYPMFGIQPNARCDDGVNSIIVKNVMDPNTPVPDNVPANYNSTCSGAPFTFHSGSL